MKKLRGTDLELKFQSLLIISATYSEQENSGHCISFEKYPGLFKISPKRRGLIKEEGA